jgi:hypothetical protein
VVPTGRVTQNPVSRELGVSAERPRVRKADYTDMWSALDRYCALEDTLSVVPQIIPQEALELSEALEGKIRSHFE